MFNTDEQLVTWSPSLNHDAYDFLAVYSKYYRLMPPFLNKERDRQLAQQKRARIIRKGTVVINAIRRMRMTEEADTESTKVKIQDHSLTCTNHEGQFLDAHGLNRKGISRKSYVRCEDDCRTKALTCEGLEGETNSFAEGTEDELYDVHEFRDEDYQRSEEELEGDETMDEGQETQTAVPWSLDRCESFFSLSEAEEDPADTVDPCLSHKLNTPYSKTPKPRISKFNDETDVYAATTLPRRLRSPVRKILPGKFDLRAAYEKWRKERRLTETRKCLRESKDHIRQSIEHLGPDQLEGDGLITSLVVQMLCEEVSLALMGVKIVTDVHTVVNIAMILALTELHLVSDDLLTDEQSGLFAGLGIFDQSAKVNEIDKTENSGMRKILLGAYRAPLNRTVDTTFHRRLPWPYISPSHHRGQTKFYPNVREWIDEKEPKANDKDLSPFYVPDLKCFHLRGVLDKSYVVYKRKSKYPAPSSGTIELLENLFVQLISFM